MSLAVIVMQDGMLAAATGLPGISKFYRPKEAISLQRERYQASNASYPAWYLFGCAPKNTAGLVTRYTQLGYETAICPESMLGAAGSFAALLDVQFSGDSIVPMPAGGLSGYLPDRYASKAQQARELWHGGHSRFLPAQACFDRFSDPSLPSTENDTFIVKDTLGSGRRGSDGTPYTVWQKDRLQEALPGLLAALPPGRQLLISEFIHTSDPYAGYADHVVHKMHFTSSRQSDGRYQLAPYGRKCQVIIHRCRRDLLKREGVLTLSRYTGLPEYGTGDVCQIREFDRLTAALSFFAQSRLILSVDFIIPPDGLPRFLEANKLGATFAETFDPSLPPVIDAYPELSL